MKGPTSLTFILIGLGDGMRLVFTFPSAALFSLTVRMWYGMIIELDIELL